MPESGLQDQTYEVELDDVEAEYAEAILALPTVRDWTRDAHKEPWKIAEFDQA